VNAIRTFGRRASFQALGDGEAPPPDPPPSYNDTRTWWEKQDGISRALIYWATGVAGSAVVGAVIGNRVVPENRGLGTLAGAATGAVVGFGGGLVILRAQSDYK
jgi:hypothetical protein